MNDSSLPKWLLPSIAVAALLSLLSIALRYRVESHNKAAMIAIEVETAEAVGLSQGVSLDETLSHYKAEGMEGIVLTEETVGDLMTLHQIEVDPGPVLRGSDAALSRVSAAIARRFQGLNLKPVNGQIDLRGPNMPTVFNLRMLSVGLDDDEVAASRRAGLHIIGRYGNPMGATPGYVETTLENAHAQGVEVFLPVGDQVLGRRDSTKTLVATLRRLGMDYASPEFAKLGGDENVVAMAGDIVVRLHSAQAAELDKLTYSEAIDRFARAARERNQRILLLRPPNFSSAQPMSDLGKFITDVRKEILRQGGDTGVAKPFEDAKVPKLLFLLIGLALAPPIWCAAAFFVADPKIRKAGAALLGLLALGCYLPSETAHFPTRPAMAFLASVAFPVLAFKFLLARRGRNWLVEYLVVSAISLVGGLGIAGLMNGLPYYIRAEQFEGVKVAVFLPIVVVALMAYASLANLKESVKSPITWAQAGLTLVLLAAMAFMISRTGNDNPAGVSTLELKLRYLLDTVLFVRPRTKEFLVGHPFLILGIGMLIKQRSGWKAPKGFGGWTALALTIGAVGQTDIVNTMCHFHTPVALSLVRIAVGLAAGGILGAILWSLVGRFLSSADSSDGSSDARSPERSTLAH